jgi:hypothetical protein
MEQEYYSAKTNELISKNILYKDKEDTSYQKILNVKRIENKENIF